VKIVRLFFLVLSLILTFSCSTRTPVNYVKVKSPLGLYKSNTSQKYWIAIMQEYQYLLCSTKRCIKGEYERVPSNYGVILLNFFDSDIGLNIEELSHGFNNSQSFYSAMKAIRLESNRPNDFAFNIGDCNGVPCVGIGHTREGVKFYRIEDFNDYWQKEKEVKLND
jgi:hypothetical protein